MSENFWDLVTYYAQLIILIIQGDGGEKLTFDTFEAIAGNRPTGLHFSKIMYFVNTSIKLPGVSLIIFAIG